MLVLDAVFDTPERQKFARQLTVGALLESDKLKGVVLLSDGQVSIRVSWSWPFNGEKRLFQGW